MKNSYKIWTWRALLVWIPISGFIAITPPICAFVMEMVPWHFYMTTLLFPLLVGFIVWRRHDQHARIKKSITLEMNGLYVVNRCPWNLSEAEITAIQDGLDDARATCAWVIGHSPRAPWKGAFLIIEKELHIHRAGKKHKVAGLTYFGGPMVIAYTADLKALFNVVRHEGCHRILNMKNIPDFADSHHREYPELFS